MKKRGKKGDLLIENILFIILNFVFLTILVLFLLKQGSGAVLLEKTYSKQIALLIDSSEPGMTLKLNMEKVLEVVEENGFDFSKSVYIDGNYVYVKLSEDGGKGYSFFNDVSIVPTPNSNVGDVGYSGVYTFKITVKKNA